MDAPSSTLAYNERAITSGQLWYVPFWNQRAKSSIETVKTSTLRRHHLGSRPGNRTCFPFHGYRSSPRRDARRRRRITYFFVPSSARTHALPAPRRAPSQNAPTHDPSNRKRPPPTREAAFIVPAFHCPSLPQSHLLRHNLRQVRLPQAKLTLVKLVHL